MREPLEGAYDLVNLRAAQLGAERERPWYARVSRVAAFFVESAEVRDVTKATVRAYLDAYDPAENAETSPRSPRSFGRMAGRGDVAVGVVVYPIDVPARRLPAPAVSRPGRAHGARSGSSRPRPRSGVPRHGRGVSSRASAGSPPERPRHDVAARAIAEWIVREPRLRW